MRSGSSSRPKIMACRVGLESCQLCRDVHKGAMRPCCKVHAEKALLSNRNILLLAIGTMSG